LIPPLDLWRQAHFSSLSPFEHRALACLFLNRNRTIVNWRLTDGTRHVKVNTAN
jgi:hypothetical protein